MEQSKFILILHLISKNWCSKQTEHVWELETKNIILLSLNVKEYLEWNLRVLSINYTHNILSSYLVMEIHTKIIKLICAILMTDTSKWRNLKEQNMFNNEQWNHLKIFILQSESYTTRCRHWLLKKHKDSNLSLTLSSFDV